MILIDEVLIESPVAEAYFACDLDACKGACCWEGDYGAPLDADEVEQVEALLPQVLPLLGSEAKKILAEEGHVTYYAEMKKEGTPLMADKSCVYLIKDGDIAKCAFEVLHQEGKSEWRKPISCHLYPIRIEQQHQSGFTQLRYDQWDICSPACSNGKKSNTRLFEFAKAALVRKYGQEWYDRLEWVANEDYDNES